MSTHADYRWRVFLAACEVQAAWRCQRTRNRETLTEDLRQQLDKLVLAMDAQPEHVRPMGVGGDDAA